MRNPLVSVIMATYNHESFVAEAINSVLMQNGVDFEFLIADDGSVDNTRNIVASFDDARIHFSPNEINRGACIVTNELIERSSGEFIALINSDDSWIDETKLAYQVQVLHDHPEIGACFGRARFIDKDGQSIVKSTLHFGTIFDQGNRTQGAWLRRFFELGNCICHPTMLIRKSCYRELGAYSNRLRQLPDLDMWIRLVKRYPIHISERELINFRILPGENASSQTAANSIRTINEHYLIADTFFDDVSPQQLTEGFSDLLKSKTIDSIEQLEIEKALLFFIDNQWLNKPYQMIGLLKLNNLLNNTNYQQMLLDHHMIDDRWFHTKMSEIDVLRPKFIAAIGNQKNRVVNFIKRLSSYFQRS